MFFDFGEILLLAPNEKPPINLLHDHMKSSFHGQNIVYHCLELQYFNSTINPRTDVKLKYQVYYQYKIYMYVKTCLAIKRNYLLLESSN